MDTAAQGRQMCGARQTLFESITRRQVLPSGADSGGTSPSLMCLERRGGGEGASVGKRKGNEVVEFSCGVIWSERKKLGDLAPGLGMATWQH